MADSLAFLRRLDRRVEEFERTMRCGLDGTPLRAERSDFDIYYVGFVCGHGHHLRVLPDDLNAFVSEDADG